MRYARSLLHVFSPGENSPEFNVGMDEVLPVSIAVVKIENRVSIVFWTFVHEFGFVFDEDPDDGFGSAVIVKSFTDS